MVMTGSALSSLLEPVISAALIQSTQSVPHPPSGVETAYWTAVGKAIADAIGPVIITYLQTNAGISVTTLGLATTVSGSPGAPVTGAIAAITLAQGGLL